MVVSAPFAMNRTQSAGMNILDRSNYALGAIVRYPLRSSMLLIAIAIGVSAVLVLTSLGEGARRYVTQQFDRLGTDMLIVTPGKTELSGGGIDMSIGLAPRPLTLQDVSAMLRSPHVQAVLPFIGGTGKLNRDGRERDVDVVGTNEQMQTVFDYEMQAGRFLPAAPLDESMAIAVIGSKVAEELFSGQSPVGQRARIGDRRVRVIGVVAQTGQAGSVDVDETVFVPIAFAAQIFNTDSVQKMMVRPHSKDLMDAAKADIIRIVKARHQGHDDITVMDQGSILTTFNGIFLVLTSTLAGIASISLFVAGVLIMNVMLVAVSQRTEEVGLIKALGAHRQQIIGLFLFEAAILSFLGALLGLLLGELAITLLRELYPAIDFRAPVWASIAAVLIAVGSGLLFGIMPARRAAALDPIAALAGH